MMSAAGRSRRTTTAPRPGPAALTNVAKLGALDRVLVRSQYVEQADASELLAGGEGGIGYLLKEGRTNSAIGRALVVTGGAVEKHISSIFVKLGLPPSDDEHRRVKAVLAWLQPGRRVQHPQSPVWDMVTVTVAQVRTVPSSCACEGLGLLECARQAITLDLQIVAGLEVEPEPFGGAEVPS